MAIVRAAERNITVIFPVPWLAQFATPAEMVQLRMSWQLGVAARDGVWSINWVHNYAKSASSDRVLLPSGNAVE